jgi:hypothetical protein
MMWECEKLDELKLLHALSSYFERGSVGFAGWSGNMAATDTWQRIA